MTATATPTAPKFEEPTDRQVETINDLASELGVEIVMPRTKKVATRLIFSLKRQAEDLHGDKLPPTSRQLRFLVQLAEERGREPYKVPATRKQASAKISQILAAAKPAEQEAVAA
jgi:hypothetical protein